MEFRNTRRRWLGAAAIATAMGYFGHFVASLNERSPVTSRNTHWEQTTPLNVARRAVAAAASMSHLYVVGGIDNNDQYVNTAEFTDFSSRGGVGNWKQTSPLTEPRFYLAAVVYHNYLFAIGGATGPRGEENIPSPVVERAAILPDGSLGPWELQAYLTTPRRGLTAVVSNGFIYAVGGYNGTFLRTVERAHLDEKARITRWELDAQFAQVDRYIHSAAASDKHIYLLAGHMQHGATISYGDVEMTGSQPDGRLSPWKILPGRLVVPRFIASAAALNGYLYLVGGHDGSHRLSAVEFAATDALGQTSDWKLTTPLQYARSGAALIAHGNGIYIIGGSGENGALASVEFSRQLPNGELLPTDPPATGFYKNQ